MEPQIRFTSIGLYRSDGFLGGAKLITTDTVFFLFSSQLRQYTPMRCIRKRDEPQLNQSQGG
eukprot:scaffold620295_cov37-Prasinocladus_malaysianus.AAC.1